MTHVIMPGSDSKDSGFGDDLALSSMQAAHIRIAGPASGKKTQTKGAIGWRAAGLGDLQPAGRCELGASRWSA